MKSLRFYDDDLRRDSRCGQNPVLYQGAVQAVLFRPRTQGGISFFSEAAGRDGPFYDLLCDLATNLNLGDAVFIYELTKDG